MRLTSSHQSAKSFKKPQGSSWCPSSATGCLKLYPLNHTAVMLTPLSYSPAPLRFLPGNHYTKWHNLICYRRKILREILTKFGDGKVKLLSTSTPIIIGTPFSMTSCNIEMKERIEKSFNEGILKYNPCTKSDLVPEFTASPHPRFLGLA